MTLPSLGSSKRLIWIRLAPLRSVRARHFGWPAEVSIAATALFGFVMALKIRPKGVRIHEETRIHDAARALRRAFISNRSGADADPVMRQPAETAAASAVSETSTRNTDGTAAEPKDGIAAALREAFDVGKAHEAQELKAVMDAFLVERGRAAPDAGLTGIAERRTNGGTE